MATSVETVLVAATLPSPDLPPLHSALGKKQFCWEERVKLLDLWVPGYADMGSPGNGRIWFLPSILPPNLLQVASSLCQPLPL